MAIPPFVTCYFFNLCLKCIIVIIVCQVFIVGYVMLTMVIGYSEFFVDYSGLFGNRRDLTTSRT